MQFVSTVALVAAAFSLACDAKFYIKSKSLHGRDGMYSGLYLTPFHTGGGESVPTFKASKKEAAEFSFNHSQLITYIFGGGPYVLGFGQEEDAYALWASMTLDLGGPDKFVVNDRGFIVSHSNRVDFGGWRICEWVHGVPELFFGTGGPGGTNTVVPSNCELVHLTQETV